MYMLVSSSDLGHVWPHSTVVRCTPTYVINAYYNVVRFISDKCIRYNFMWLKFVTDLQQVDGFC